MNTRNLVIGLVILAVIGAGGYYGYTSFYATSEDPNENTPKLDFEHSFPENATQLGAANVKEAPSYDDALIKHNNKMETVSYTFTYSRDYNEGSIQLETSVNRETQNILTTSRISQSDTTIIKDGFYSEGTNYARLRQPDTDPENWEYRSREMVFDDVTKTGYSELNSLKISGVEFEFDETVTREGTKYYVYEPNIVDREAFENNPWSDPEETPESVSIDGEVLFSEQGVVTSARVEYKVDDVTVDIKYSLTRVGPKPITEPVWLPNAENSESN